MESITIRITGKNAAVQASAIMKSFYKTMTRMEDGGVHVQVTTGHTDEDIYSTGKVGVPNFIAEAVTGRKDTGRR